MTLSGSPCKRHTLPRIQLPASTTVWSRLSLFITAPCVLGGLFHPQRYEPKRGASQVAIVVKTLPANAGDERDVGSIPGPGRSPGGGHGDPLQHSCLENPMDRGAWQSTVHRVAKSQTWEKWLSTHARTKWTQTPPNTISWFSEEWFSLFSFWGPLVPGKGLSRTSSSHLHSLTSLQIDRMFLLSKENMKVVAF